MLSVILNCSNGMELYVLKNEEVYETVVQDAKHTDELLSALDKLFDNAGVDISETDNICVCVGPGSFTGIRVAISIAKGLAVGTGAKIFVCSNFDILQIPKITKKNILIALDAFSKYVYIKKISNGQEECSCVETSELKKYNLDEWEILTDCEKTQNKLKNDEICSQIAQKQIILYFKNKILNDDFVEINEIEPIYLRASQAEIEREKNLKK